MKDEVGTIADGAGGAVGVVMGAGGVLGTAWLLGSLRGLAAASGWTPTDATLVIGTSAGAIVGALAAAGRWPVPGEALDEALLTRLEAVSRWRLARPGWPPGLLSIRAVATFIEWAVPGGWPTRPQLWIPTTDCRSRGTVVFRRDGAPPASLPLAVAASCAMPGVFKPVRIDGRDYADGAVASGPGLSLTAGLGLDLVVCLNPGSADLLDGSRLMRAVWGRWHRQVVEQAAKVEAGGTRVVIVEPSPSVVKAMGLNLMRRRGAREIGALAAADMADHPASRALMSVVLSR